VDIYSVSAFIFIGAKGRELRCQRQRERTALPKAERENHIVKGRERTALPKAERERTALSKADGENCGGKSRENCGTKREHDGCKNLSLIVRAGANNRLLKLADNRSVKGRERTEMLDTRRA
jgi:hypothetical protein